MTPFAEGTLLRAAAAAPSVDVTALAGSGVLALVPHPDDETLACGSALSALVERGRHAHVVVVTDGGGSHPKSVEWPAERVAARRAEELASALEVLGRGGITSQMLGYPDQGSPEPDNASVARTLSALAATMDACNLSTIWTTWEGDPHPDHIRCAALAQALARHYKSRTERDAPVLRCPVWGRFVEAGWSVATDELLRFDASNALRDTKARALACHASQMTPLINDDPEGFVMPLPMQQHFIDHGELFIRQRMA